MKNNFNIKTINKILLGFTFFLITSCGNEIGVNEEIGERRIFALSFIGFYLIYLLFSKYILVPFVLKKAKKQIGGKVEISKDPLKWILPILFVSGMIIKYSKDIF